LASRVIPRYLAVLANGTFVPLMKIEKENIVKVNFKVPGRNPN
jgi:hypothetical protein